MIDNAELIKNEISTLYEKYIFYINNVENILTGKDDIISRSEIVYKNVLGEEEINIMTLQNNLSINIFDNVKVKIELHHLTTSTFNTLFIGNMVGYNIEKGQLLMKFRSIYNLQNKIIPKCQFKSQCNNSLYDSVCGLNKETYKVIATVTNVNNNEIYADIFSSYPGNHFTSGYCEFNNQFRIITSHTGNKITVVFPFTGLTAGNNIIAYAGCNKTYEDCISKFDNLNNFVGFPYLPPSEPQEETV